MCGVGYSPGNNTERQIKSTDSKLRQSFLFHGVGGGGGPYTTILPATHKCYVCRSVFLLPREFFLLVERVRREEKGGKVKKSKKIATNFLRKSWRNGFSAPSGRPRWNGILYGWQPVCCLWRQQTSEPFFWGLMWNSQGNLFSTLTDNKAYCYPGWQPILFIP